MAEKFTYQQYVSDADFLQKYNDYQNRYAEKVRESDKVIVSLVNDVIVANGLKKPVLLDIGCSTGNLLMHLRNSLPAVDYVGGDLAESSLEQCKSNAKLDGIDFQILDIVDLPEAAYDIVIVNAVLYMFDEKQYQKAVKSIFKSLRPNGVAIIYDFAHPFEHQNLEIFETSVLHPDGLRLCFRPMKKVSETIVSAGFSKVDFLPFELPIDLPKPPYDEEVVTYTVNDSSNHRMMFRGVLYQPWCHMVARKAG